MNLQPMELDSSSSPSKPARAAPASARDALIAEMLADVGLLQESIDKLKADLPNLALEIAELVGVALEASAKKGAQTVHNSLINPPGLDISAVVEAGGQSLQSKIAGAGHELIVRMKGTTSDSTVVVEKLLKSLDERLAAVKKTESAAEYSMWISIGFTTLNLILGAVLLLPVFKPLVASWIR